jgi:aminoglycoside phosphotransferase family enzyme/predicted kinase
MSDRSANDKLLRLIQSLETSADFDHPVDQFEIVETHISYILLTGPYAYKFKKPVDLGFLDFSTLNKRKHYCEEELRLNGRHAAELYQDVITITGDEQSPVINGKGPTLEYAVKIVQFDRNLELDKLIVKEGLTPTLIDKLATVIAAFHKEAKVADEKSDAGSLTYIWHPVAENFSQIKARLHNDRLYSERLESLAQWSEAEFEKLRHAFKVRKAQGFVRECHGDMHLGNIVLINNEPVIFDCIEFSEYLRWIDVINDIAFLVMDLDEHECPELSYRLLNAYLEHTGDYAGLDVLHFYLVYRAVVLAKVACIRLDQEHHDKQAQSNYQHYIDMACTYTEQQQAVLFMTYGVSSSGKTTVSQSLLERWGAIRIRSDLERKELQGLAADAKTGSPVGGGLYSPENTQRTYNKLSGLSIDLLNAGYSVIVDATFLQACYRRDFIELAYACNVSFVILHCRASEERLKKRIQQRHVKGDDASEADLNVLAHQLETLEPLNDDEKQFCVTIDTDQELDIDTILTTIKSELKQW